MVWRYGSWGDSAGALQPPEIALVRSSDFVQKSGKLKTSPTIKPVPSSTVASVELESGVASIVIASSPVNALGNAVRAAILAMVDWANGEPSIDAIVLRCSGRTFFAGADIREFGKPMVGPPLQEVILALERSLKPVVAAIHGTALGGGLEVALACDYRVALPSAKFALPEVKLGIMPGAGGSQRLPRLVGVEWALEFILSGRQADAEDALSAGLLDEVVGDLEADARAAARRIVVARNRPLPARDRTAALKSARRDPALVERFVERNAKKFRGLEAADAIVKAIRASFELPFDEGIALERRLFVSLLEGAQSAALRHVFFAEREAGKIPGLPADTSLRAIESVGLIGAGTMGSGIAINFLLSGIPVTLVDMTDQALRRGVKHIDDMLDRNVASGRINEATAAQAKARLRPSGTFEDLSLADLVVEAAFETMQVKRDIFTRLDSVAKSGAILATNTSYLNIDEIASVTGRPQDVIGLHFFSPANVMKLLEVVRAERTADDVLATSLALAKRIGKVPVVAGVAHGFIGNRMLRVRKQAGDALLMRGVSPYSIDAVIEAFGMPMGPFRMYDLAGLDIGWSVETSKGMTIQERLCEMGRRGQKTGAGYYDYDEKRHPRPSADVLEMIAALSTAHGASTSGVSDEEVLQQLLYPMINEGFRILDEGKAYRASDIDIVWINGYGWPAWTGGPMYYAEQVGAANIVAALAAMGRSGEIADGLRARTTNTQSSRQPAPALASTS